MAVCQLGQYGCSCHMLFGILSCVFLLIRPVDPQLLSLSMTPSNVDLSLGNQNSVYSKTNKPYIQCGMKTSDFIFLNISRTLLDGEGNPVWSTRQTVLSMSNADAGSTKTEKYRLIPPFFNVNKTRFAPFARIVKVGTEWDGQLKLTFDQIKCTDQAIFACEIRYNFIDKKTNQAVPTNQKIEERLSIKPFGLKITQTSPASNTTPIVDGTKIVATCSGAVGTISMGGAKSQLIWAYRTAATSTQNDLTRLEGGDWIKNVIIYGIETDVNTVNGMLCSRRQEVTIEFIVNKHRDSNRVYHCAVLRTTASRKLSIESFNDEGDQYITIPNFNPPAKKITIGYGGLIGAIAATAAFLSIGVFGFVWFRKVKAKKLAREEEIANRKHQIDDRRESIVRVVTERKNVVQAEDESEAESTAEQ